MLPPTPMYSGPYSEPECRVKLNINLDVTGNLQKDQLNTYHFPYKANNSVRKATQNFFPMWCNVMEASKTKLFAHLQSKIINTWLRWMHSFRTIGVFFPYHACAGTQYASHTSILQILKFSEDSYLERCFPSIVLYLNFSSQSHFYWYNLLEANYF